MATRTLNTSPVVNDKIVTTAELEEWDDCPKCVYGQVHSTTTGTLACMDACGFETTTI